MLTISKRRLLVCSITVSVIVALLMWQGWQTLNSEITVDEPVQLDVRPGSAFNTVLKQLTDSGLVVHPLPFKAYVFLNGYSSQIKAGEYRFESTISPLAVLQKLLAGDVLQYKFTIVEGWTFRQTLDALSQLKDTLSVQAHIMSAEDIMKAVGSPELHPEGQFLPDTYQYVRGSSDVDLLVRAHRALNDFIAQEWDKRDESIPIKTPYEALTLASIVEKETGAAFERPEIAGVFMSRLKINMKLQTDPTIIYGLGESFDGDIRRKHLKQDTPYNTYTRHGLTPTPIAMAGKAAIRAVLHPAETKALYFVSRGDGTHKFSATLEEHEAAVDKYQRKRKSK